MHQYMRETITINTDLDTSKMSKPIVTMTQGDVVLNAKEVTKGDAGAVYATFTARQMGKLSEGFARIQLRGMLEGNEFATEIYNVRINGVLHKAVIE